MSASPTLCVYCRRQPATSACLPFCSERCKMADLGQWLTGTYRVPVAPAAPDDTRDTDLLIHEHDEEDTLQ